MTQLGEKYHYDEATGLDATENDESVLTWHVKLVVNTQPMTEEQLAELQKILGKEAAALAMYDISLIDVLTGKEYTPESPVSMKLANVDKGDFSGGAEKFSAVCPESVDEGKSGEVCE